MQCKLAQRERADRVFTDRNITKHTIQMLLFNGFVKLALS